MSPLSLFQKLIVKQESAPAVWGKDKPATEICETNSKAPGFKSEFTTL